MGELIATFHIDWRLMLAQLVNFAIVFFVLWRFALKPLVKTMNERSATIEQSLKNAEAIDQKLQSSNAEVEEKIREAKHQAMAIIENAKTQAEVKRQELLTSAKQDVEKVIATAKQQIRQEKDAMLDGAKQELANLVVAATRRALERDVTESVDTKVVKDRINKLK